MRICGVEEADMTNEGSVYAAYAYLAYVETNLGELGEEDPPLSPPPPLSGDRAAASLNLHRPSPLLSSTDSARRPRWKLLLRGDLSWQASPRGTRLDFLSRLPPEIAVYILRFLHPKYLCRYDLSTLTHFECICICYTAGLVSSPQIDVTA